MSENETKTRILEVATELFARHGFEGASIREIAREAGVNLAAVNYHFQNKQNLYYRVMDTNCLKMEADIAEMGADQPTVSVLVQRIFDYFLERRNEMKNSFKVILMDSEHFPTADEVPEDHMGPPGGEVLYATIERQIGENAPMEAKMWATKVIFGQITHLSLIVSSSWVRHRCGKMELFEKAYQIKHFKHLVASLLTHIQSGDWENLESV